MKLLHNKLWVAIGLGVLSGPALAAPAANCTLTPPTSVVYVGQSVQLSATCDGILTSIDWKEGGGSVSGGPVTVSGDSTNTPLSFTYPATAAGEFTFSVTGVPSVTANSAKVVVLPSAGVVTGGASAWSGGTAPTSFAATCGTANNQLLEIAPTAAQQCDLTKGQPALFVTGPSQFSWSCISLTGGAEDNCYATRSVFYMVTTSASGGTGGSISASAKVAAGTSANVTATPPAGWNTSWGGTCGGTPGGNTSYTTNAVTGPCTVTATFSSAPAAINGACGTANGQTFSSAPTANLCSAGTASAVATGSSYTWNCAGSNGGSTASCSATIPAPVSSSEDPGFGKGLWVPSNTTDRVIADQSGPGVQNLTDYLPGCLNGLLPPTASASGCGGMASYTGTLYGTSTSYTFQYGSGKTLGLRFMSKANAGTSMKYFLMYSGDGGSTGGPVSIWLSQDPTATYATTPAACKSQSTTQPYVITGPGYCPIEANKMYYLFTKVDINCTTCRYRIEENASDFY